MQQLSRSKQLGLGHLMYLIALLPPQEQRPPPEKLLGDDRCSGAVVGLDDADALELPG